MLTESENNQITTIGKNCCINCNKQYSRKSSLDKHKILCDFKLKTKREKQIDIEELADIPNHADLVKIVQELTLKQIKMEERLENMQKWVEKKKRKLDVITWLNTNVIPTIGFLEWVTSSVCVLPEHFESLMENNLYKTIQQIFEYNLPETNSFIYPIKCFSEKTNIFYICEKKVDGTPEWKQMLLTDMIMLLKNIQNKMIRETTKWKSKNECKFDDNIKISELFNKAVIKLMSISFSQDSTMSRIRNGLYNYLKSDLKSMIEYDFNF